MENITQEAYPNRPKYATSKWYVANSAEYRMKNREWTKASIQRAIEKDPETWYKKKRDEKNAKYANDPEWAEKRRQTQRAYYQRKKAEKEALQIKAAVATILET